MEIKKMIRKEKNVTVSDVKNAIEEIAPVSLQEAWDNSGLLIGFENETAEKILTCLELDEAVAEEAVAAGVDMVVTHHPLIFGGIKAVSDGNAQGRTIMKLIKNGISVYSCHTPFDKIKGGNNDMIAELLDLGSLKNLRGDDVESPSKMADRMDEADIGRIGKLKKPMSFMDFIAAAADKLNMSIRDFRMVGDLDREITSIGICTGAGADLIEMAAAAGCQLMITGDVKYHEAQSAKELGICVLDAGHYGTEKFFAVNMKKKLDKELDGRAEVTASEVNIDPFMTV